MAFLAHAPGGQLGPAVEGRGLGRHPGQPVRRVGPERLADLLVPAPLVVLGPVRIIALVLLGRGRRHGDA
eukprot:11595067-Alexandrium_andersonii.AAC.1